MRPRQWPSPAPKALRALPAMAMATPPATALLHKPRQHLPPPQLCPKKRASLPGSRACLALVPRLRPPRWPRLRLQHLATAADAANRAVMAAAKAGAAVVAETAPVTAAAKVAATPIAMLLAM